MGRLLKQVSMIVATAMLCCQLHRSAGQGPPPPPPPQSGTNVPNQNPPVAAANDQATTDAELPGAIYKEAMHPVDVVRQSLDNWSDSELAALGIGMHLARQACDKMNPDDYSNNNLYDLAHLCAFGQDWNPANTAAQLYLRSRAPEHQIQAFAISISALVHIGAPDLALATTRGMMGYPYDAELAYAVRYMKDYLENTGSPEAVKLAEEEHAKIVNALSKGTPLKAAYGDAVVSIGLLYQMAMEAAFFERYAGNDAHATQDLYDVEQALPQNAALTAEDRQEIDSVRLQYHLLGTEVERIPVIRSYKSAATKAQSKVNLGTNFGAATVLVVFPDWCEQCKKMMPTMTQFATVNAETPIHAYGLNFKEDGEETMPDTEKELLGTDVMEISEQTARSFGASEYPLGIVADHAGVIRFIGVLPGDAFNGGGYMEKVITRMVGVKIKTVPVSRPGQ
jgi:thiol-disulfide isomerase/thioredoxin